MEGITQRGTRPILDRFRFGCVVTKVGLCESRLAAEKNQTVLLSVFVVTSRVLTESESGTEISYGVSNRDGSYFEFDECELECA